MSLRLITPASTYPVTTDEARAQCRVDTTDENTLIDGLIAAATDYVEQYTGRAIMAQTWELVLDAFTDAMLLPKGPVQSVSSVKYYDADSVLQTLGDTNYSTDLVSNPAWVVRVTDVSWPTVADGVNNVIIRFVAGYSTVPPSIKHAILLLVSLWFDSRSPLSGVTRAAPEGSIIPEVPHAVGALLANYRAFGF